MTDHDAAYRSLFSDKQMVADLIRGFIREPWVQQLNLETLELVSGSFVSEKFQKRESDVIWRVAFRDLWLYIYIVIEFQSTVDRLMALRMMVYVGLLYQRLIDEGYVKPNESLPPVLPIVLYNGKERWWAADNVLDLIAECPDELARYQPQMRYFLLEEHRADVDELVGMENLAALVFRFEQCRTREDFERVIDALRAWARRPEHSASLKRLARWVQMLLSAGRLSARSVMDLEDIQECGTMLKEQVKLWEEELRAEGRAQGRAEGLAEGLMKGKAEGKAEGEAAVLVRQLRRKFGELPDAFRRRIEEADSEQLLAWAERILTAETIEEVFER